MEELEHDASTLREKINQASYFLDIYMYVIKYKMKKQWNEMQLS